MFFPISIPGARVALSLTLWRGRRSPGGLDKRDRTQCLPRLPFPAVAGSFHPNAAGMQALADAVLEIIERPRA